MQPTRHLPRRALFAGAAMLIATLSCGREVTGPADGVRFADGFAFVTTFAAGTPASAIASDVVPYDRVRVVLRRTDGRIAFDRVVDFPSTSQTIELDLRIELDREAPASGEQMDFSLRYINTAGDTVFAAGPVPVTVVPNDRDGEPSAPVQVDADYVGPGAEATTVAISQSGLTVTAGDPFTFTAVATDPQQQPVAAAPIGWYSLDVALATLTAPTAGAGVTLAGRGTARIVAQLMNGPADTVLLTVHPRAAAIERASGNAQTGTVGAMLAQPVVVRVLASDNLPMAGVTVNFAAANGGAVSAPSAVSDGNGLAQVNWTLGTAPGAQSLTATVAGLAGSPLTFTATAQAVGPDVVVITAQPQTTTAGATMPDVVVQVRDAQGNVRTNYTGQVDIRLGANPGDTDFESGTVVTNAVAGVATFPGLSITTAAVGYTIIATAATIGEVTSTAFNITHAPGSFLDFVSQPSNAFVDAVISPAVSVRVLDAFGNLATGHAGIVTIDFGGSTGATLGGTRSVVPSAGIASFGDLSVNEAGSYTLAASGAGLDGATSASFTIIEPAGTAVQWTNAAGGSWNVGTNWSTGIVPTATDSVVIGLDGTYTVTVDANTAVGALTIGGGSGTRTLALGTRTLGVVRMLTVLSNAGLTLDGGTLNGGGTVMNEGTITLMPGTLANALDNNGTLVARGTSTVSGALTTGPLSLIRALGSSADGTGALIVSNGFTNNGMMEITSIDGGFSASVTVTNGTLVNSSSGTIAPLPGAGGGRTLAAELQNHGLLSVTASMTLARASAQHVNTGTIDIAAPQLTITQSGTAPTFTSNGIINIAPGEILQVNGGLLDLTAGVTNGGGGELRTANATVAFLVPTTRTRLFLQNSTVPGTLTIPAGDSLVLVGANPTMDVVVDGLLLVQGTTTLNGTITTTPAGVIRVRGSSAYGTGTLFIPHAQANAGTIEMTSINGGFSSALTVTGTLTNLPGGTLAVLQGQGGSRTITGALLNQGTFTTATTATLTGTDVDHVNTGTMAIGAATFSVNQTPAGSFTNTGLITLASGTRLDVNAGALDLTGGQLNGGLGTLATSSVALTFTVPEARTRLNLVNTTVPGTFTIPANDSIVLVSATPTMNIVNEGLLISQGITVLSGSLTSTGLDTLRVRGSSNYGTSAMTIPAPFTNLGRVELTSIDGGFSSSLTVNGTLTNAPSGTIVSATGQGGARTLGAELHNQGTLLTPLGLTLSRAAATHQNTGVINVTTGNLTVTQTSGGFFMNNGGTITLTAGRTLDVTNGTLDLTGGQVNGGLATLSTTGTQVIFTVPEARTRLNLVNSTVPGTFTIPANDSLVLVSATPTMTLVNQGLLITRGTTTFAGSIATAGADTIRVQGSSAYGTAALTLPAGFTNNGVIQLTSVDGGFSSVLTVPGTLTNAPSGRIRSETGQGGARTLTTQLLNQGIVALPAALTLGQSGVAHVNNGTIDVSGGNLTVSQTAPGSFANPGTVTLASGRRMTVNLGALDLTGGQVNGYGAHLETNGGTLTFQVPEARTRLELNATTVNGTVSIPPGDSLLLISGTPSMTLVNQGTLITQGSTTYAGSIATAGGTIRVRGSSADGTGALTLPAPFTNDGVIELTSINGGFTSTLNVPGTLVNSTSGTVDIATGQGGARNLNVALDNRGIINLHTAMTLARPSAAHVNTGSIHMLGGNLTLTQSGTSPGFANLPGGVIDAVVGRRMEVTGGTLDLLQGQLNLGSGVLHTTNVQLLFSIPTAIAQFDLDNTTVPLTITVPANDSLVLVDGTLDAPVVNNGVLIGMGAVTLSGAVTTGPGSVLRSRGSAQYGTSTLTVTNGFMNTAAIELTNINGGFTSNFGVTNGTLVNAPGGTITSIAASGGGRTIIAQLDNQGTLAINQATSLARGSSAHVNSGTITQAAPFTVSQSGTAPSFTNTGTITSLANTISFVNGTVDLTAGALTGTNRLLVTDATLSFSVPSVTIPMTLTNVVVPHTVTVSPGNTLHLVGGTLAAPLSTSGNVIVNGVTALTGAVTTGSTSNFRVLGNSGVGTAALTVTNGFTNNGTLEINAVGGGFTSGMTITTGALVNSATGSFTVPGGVGGSRSFTAALLDNSGSISSGLTWAANTAIDQRGTMNVTAGTTTVSGAMQLFSGSSTTVNTGATLVKTGGCTNLGGTIGGGGTGATCP